MIESGKIQTPVEVYKHLGVENYHIYHQYTVRAENRDNLKMFLEENQISTGIYYPLGLHLQKCFAGLGYKKGDFPETEKACSQVLALPIYPELTYEQQDHIVSIIKEFYSR